MIGGLLALPFIATLLRISVAIIEAVMPVLRFVLESVTGALTWLWQNMWWPGLKGAFDGLPQVLVIAQLAGVGYLFYLNAETQLARRDGELRQCRTALVKAKQPGSRSHQSPPLWDIFGWFKLP